MNRAAANPQAHRFGILIVLLVAFDLRLGFLLNSGFYVDEYITTLAAQATREFGYPLLPSGLFYNHGLPFTYLVSAFQMLMGPVRVAARFPALLFGVAAVALTYRVGRRWFSGWAGLYAATILATTATAVVWGGRTRMYTLQQTFFLLAIFNGAEGMRSGDRASRLTGLLAAILAIMAHPLTLAYLLAFGVAGLLVLAWRGWPVRLSVRPQALWPEGLMALLGGGLLIGLQFFQGTWSASGRVQTDPQVLLDPLYLIQHLLGGIHPFIVFPELVLTVFFVVGSVFLVLRLARRRPQPGDETLALIWLAFLGGVMGAAVFLVFKADRYVMAMLPLYGLVVGRELDFLGRRLGDAARQPRLQRAMAGLIGVALACLMLPPAIATARSNPIVLDCAWAYVRDHWERGDAIATGMPAVAYGWLGQVDYFAMEKGHKTFESGGRRVDIWIGAPLLDSREEMAAALARHQRLWFVMDERGWDWFYSDGFRGLVEEEMRAVAECPGMRVYVKDR